MGHSRKIKSLFKQPSLHIEHAYEKRHLKLINVNK